MSQNSELFLIFWLEGKRSMGEEELHKKEREVENTMDGRKERKRVGEVQLTIFCER